MPNVKMGADISSFKSGIAAAKSEVKTLDQQMKMLDATLKAEGKSEQTLAMQTQTLNQRMAAQKNMANQAEAALKAMTKAGIDPTSEAYQRMAREMLAAQTGMMETQAELNDLGSSAITAAGGVGQLETGLNGISKKISLEQVKSVVDNISGGLENAAKKAVNLGKAIWENITDVARFSDDTATQAMILNMNVEDYQAYKKVFDTVGEITVQEWQKAKLKVQKAINDPTKDQVDVLQILGISTKQWGSLKGQSGQALIGKNFEDMFWEIGETLRKKVESGEMTQDLADTYANTLFGKSFANLNPMFAMGKNAFEEEVQKQIVASKEAIQKNAELNDKLIKLQGDFESLKVEVLSGFAPALTAGAEALDGLLERVMEYLKTPEGQEALKDMETAVSGLFEDLGKIDPEQVVSGFTDVFNTIVDSLKWLAENKDAVGDSLKAIVGAWAGLRLTGGALEVLKLVNGLKDLMGIGGGAAGAAGAAGATGLTGGTLGASLMAGAGKVAGLFGSQVFQNTAPGVYDWLMNQTDVGMWLRGTKTPGDTWNEFKGNVEKNAGTFEQDWRENVLTGWMFDLGENSIKFWDQFWKGATEHPKIEITEEDLIPMDEQTLQLKLMEQIRQGGVQIPVEPEAPSDAAADIAAQIGTVTVYVEPIVGDPVNNTDKRRRNGLNGIPGYANGIQFVPDTRLAWLHPGETVTPARQVASRSYSSNLYVEKMIMNNGTDARGLADEIAAAQRRQAGGFGS